MAPCSHPVLPRWKVRLPSALHGNFPGEIQSSLASPLFRHHMQPLLASQSLEPVLHCPRPLIQTKVGCPLFYLFLAVLRGIWDLSSWTRD